MSLIEKKCLTCTEKNNKKTKTKQNPPPNSQKNQQAPIHRILPVQSKYHHRHYLDITQGINVIADGCN
jgi:hypothetical protein